MIFFFFKQKTAYEMRISDWSSDVCSSDLRRGQRLVDEHRMPVWQRMQRDGVIVFRPDPEHPALASFSESLPPERSEERRVGKECVSTCRSRWSTYHSKKKNYII